MRARGVTSQAATEPSIDGAKPVCWIDLGVIWTVIVFSPKSQTVSPLSLASEARSVSDDQLGCPTSPSFLHRGVGRQHLAHIQLGNAKLPCNARRCYACLEGCSDSIGLPARQRDRRQFSLPFIS